MQLLTSVPSTDWVDATPFRAHVADLIHESRLPWRVVAMAAGVPAQVVRSLLFGRQGAPVRRLRGIDATSLLAVSSRGLLAAERARVAAYEVPRLLTALAERRWSVADISARVDIPAWQLESLADGTAPKCSQLTLWRLKAVADASGVDPADPFDSLRRAA